MTKRDVSHTVLPGLAIMMMAVCVTAVPMVPFAHGWMGFGPMASKGPKMGQSYRCSTSFRACAQHDDETIWVQEPKLLTAVSRTIDHNTGRVEGLLVVIRDTSVNTDHTAFGHLPAGHNNPVGTVYGYGNGNGYGNGHGFGNGYGYGGGFFGSFGDLASAYRLLGGYASSKNLELTLELNVGPMAYDTKVLLVFTEAVDEDTCTPESLGHVLTSPATDTKAYDHFPSFSLHQAGGQGQSLDAEFGVIAQLTVKGGANTFKVKGIGDFTHFPDLAGRGVALCEDVTIATGGKPICAGKTFGVLACAKFGYSIHTPLLAFPPLVHGHPPQP